MSAVTYEQKKQRLIAEFLELNQAPGGTVGLGKDTSSLFRDRPKVTKHLNVRAFNQVIRVNQRAMTVEVEGMTTFEELVKATLAHGLLPLVVPELKTITIGGAVSGLAIESSSFKYGQVHESVIAMEVLLASGEVVTARRDNRYSDLFYGLPNSYGTLGYVLKVTTKLRHAKPYVRLQHLRFHDRASYCQKLEALASSGTHEGQAIDFIDGTVFGPDELYITLGFDSDTAPYASDYTFKHIYYHSIRERSEDYLATHDYIWRWDTDWFWCSKQLLLEKPLLRRLLGKKRLGSRTYFKLLRLGRRSKLIRLLGRLRQAQPTRESIIQDIEVPIDKAAEFLAWFSKTIGITPVWVCPTKSTANQWLYPLYPMDPDKLYVNFGFWDTVATQKKPDEGYYNKRIEAKVAALGGMKSLYSDLFYTRAAFEKIYNYKSYQKLKKDYDTDGRFKDLYDKCVRKTT